MVFGDLLGFNPLFSEEAIRLQVQETAPEPELQAEQLAAAGDLGATRVGCGFIDGNVNYQFNINTDMFNIYRYPAMKWVIFHSYV